MSFVWSIATRCRRVCNKSSAFLNFGPTQFTHPRPCLHCPTVPRPLRFPSLKTNGAPLFNRTQRVSSTYAVRVSVCHPYLCINTSETKAYYKLYAAARFKVLQCRHKRAVTKGAAPCKTLRHSKYYFSTWNWDMPHQSFRSPGGSVAAWFLDLIYSTKHYALSITYTHPTRWIQLKAMIPYWCYLLNPLQ